MNRERVKRNFYLVASGLVTLVILLGLLFPNGFAGNLIRIAFDPSTISSGLRLAVPIAFAAMGGIFADKSGVINVGLEGLLILSAFTAVVTVFTIQPAQSVFFLPTMWVGVLSGIVVGTLFAMLFAIACIRFKADQIIAGLALWLIGLGLAPFLSVVIFGSVNSDTVGTIGAWTVPVLSEIPYIGPVLFDATPFVYLMLLSVPLVWFIMNETKFGYRVRASGENPQALDTSGVDVHRIRYIAVALSGAFSGLGGASLSLGQVGQFLGNGQTMVNGRGFIAITTYLFGNYNPFATWAATYLYAMIQAIQFRLQQLDGYGFPDALIRILPFVIVIIVLTFVGKTVMPDKAGESYEPGEDD